MSVTMQQSEQQAGIEQSARLGTSRRTEIIKLLNRHHSLPVASLSEMLDVSEATIRRDLDKLQSDGVLVRTHGGAMIGAEKAVFRMPDTIPNIETKRRIARVAATMVEEGDTIALDAGTTTAELARCVRHFVGLTVVTNDLHIAYELTEASGITLNVTGGTLQGRFFALQGPLALKTIRSVHTAKAFLGLSALSADSGVTDPSLEAAQIKQAMVESSERTIMIADATKLAKTAFAKVVPLEAIDTLVTDSAAPTELLVRLRDRGITVMVA